MSKWIILLIWNLVLTIVLGWVVVNPLLDVDKPTVQKQQSSSLIPASSQIPVFTPEFSGDLSEVCLQLWYIRAGLDSIQSELSNIYFKMK